jgi:hypothetical protein
MRKTIFVVLVILQLIITNCRTDKTEKITVAPNPQQFKVVISDNDWNSANMEHSRYKTKEEFLAQAQEIIASVSKFVDREDWYNVYKGRAGNDFVCKINIQFTAQGTFSTTIGQGHWTADYSFMPGIALNKGQFEHDIAPIIHELTHVILLPTLGTLPVSRCLHEGIANYVQAAFGNGESVVDYGIEKYMILYFSKDLLNDYKCMGGKSLEEHKTEWCKMLESYPNTITLDGYQKHMADFWKRHNIRIN